MAKNKTLVEIFAEATEGMPAEKPVSVKAGQLRELCQLAAKATTSTAPAPVKPDAK